MHKRGERQKILVSSALIFLMAGCGEDPDDRALSGAGIVQVPVWVQQFLALHSFRLSLLGALLVPQQELPPAISKLTLGNKKIYNRYIHLTNHGENSNE